MPCKIEYEHDDSPDRQVREKIEKWANYNRFKHIKVTPQAQIIIEDQLVKLSSKAWQHNDNGNPHIPFEIIYVRNLEFTCAFHDADMLYSSFPRIVENSLLFSVGKMPPGVTDLSFIGELTRDEVELKNVLITSNRGLVTLKGCPQWANSVEISRNADLTNLTGITKHIDAELTISMNPKLTSFHNIHQHIKFIGSHLIIDGCVQRDILGLLLIDGLESILLDHNDGRSPSEDLRRSINILNKYLKEPPSSHRLLDCYEEMLEVGLSKYARI